jgi:arylsulfatase A-like enzyme
MRRGAGNKYRFVMTGRRMLSADPRGVLYCKFSMPISRRHFFFGSLALPAFAAKKPPARPNLLLFLVDDLPAWVLGCYGNKEIHTPNIDRLSQTGTRFLNHFVCTPAAAPSRATFLTGRTPLQAAGGTGLDKILGDLSYEIHTEDAATAAAFIGKQSASKQFFLIVTSSKLAAPYDGVAQKYRDLYAKATFEGYTPDPVNPAARAGKEMLSDIPGNVRKFAAALSELDAQVNTVIAAVNQKGLLDNTLIVFSSTCGSLLGRHGLWGSGDASDPVNMYDEVIGTPLFWSWAGRVPALATQVELVSSYDFVPTVCNALEIPAPAGLRGRSYLLMATGKPLPKKVRWRSTVCGNYQNTDMARVERYKVVLRDGGKGPNELYDLSADPREKANQVDDDQFASIKTSLSAEIAKWKQQ